MNAMLDDGSNETLIDEEVLGVRGEIPHSYT